MNRLSQLKAKLRAAQAELAIRTRTHNSASRAYNKVCMHILELEKKIADLENLPKKSDELHGNRSVGSVG